MKKKMLFVIATIAAFALFVPSVMAATAPKLEENFAGSGSKIFFANGNAITIEALTEGEGALIKWEGGELEVTADTTIIGGMHNDDTLVDTSITMNGGTVKHIFAGGLHKSNVGVSYVVLNGGTVTGSIMGGGYAGYVNDSDFSTSTYAPSDIENDSIVRVEEANIEINGGTIGADVFGGGGGYSYTGTASITIAETFTGEIGYVSAGGSNGYTGTASVEINGGTIDVLQAVNRGGMEESTLVVNGGEIENAYVSSEGDGTNTTGVEGTALLYVNGGSVENVAVGAVPTSPSNNNTTEVEVVYKDGTVTNVDDDIDEENIVTYVNLTFAAEVEGEREEEVIQVIKGESLTEDEVNQLIEMLEESLEGSGYVFDNFYTSDELEEVFDFTKPFTDDVLVFINIVEEEEEEEPVDTPTEEESKGEEKPEELPPKTSDINLALLIGTIMLGVVGTILVSKKRFSKSN